MNQFKIFDRIFWLIWLAFPVTVWITFKINFELPPLLADIPEDCRSNLPVPANFSWAGKFALALHLVWQSALVAYCFLLAHQAIRRCMKGSMLVADILKTLGIIAIVMMSWNVLVLLSSNALVYALVLVGDVKKFTPDYAYDVGLLAFGILLLAIRAVIAHAIKLKQDHDLTI